MKKQYFKLFAGVLVSIALLSCGGEVQPPEYEPELPELPAQEQDLFAQWRTIPADGFETMDISRAVEIANILSQAGPHGLEPFFEVLESSEEDPVIKVLATICLTPHVDQSDLPRLVALTSSEHSPATRGCAIQLLGALGDDEGLVHIRDLMADDDEHVSKVATFALLRYNDEEAVRRAVAYWEGDYISQADRNEIVLGFPDVHVLEHIDIFVEAVCLHALDALARSRAIQMVGTLAGSEALPQLKACLESEPQERFQHMLESAIAAINARTDGVADEEEE